jgi:hypothetical protein
MNSVGPIVVVVALVICIYGVVRIQSKERQTRPLYQDLLSQPVLFRGGVPVKIRLGSFWGPKTLAGMDLVVTTSGVCVVSRFPSIGRILGGAMVRAVDGYPGSLDADCQVTGFSRQRLDRVVVSCA